MSLEVGRNGCSLVFTPVAEILQANPFRLSISQ